MTNDYRDGFKDFRPGYSEPNRDELQRTYGTHTADQYTRGWDAAKTTYNNPQGNSSSNK